MIDLHDHLISKHSWNGRCNASGLAIIETCEGFSATVYRCPANVPTIGYGSTYDYEGVKVTMVHPTITEMEASVLLANEIRHTEKTIRKLVAVPLSENQFSALCSLIYNIGSGNFQRSTLRSRLNRGDYEGASAEFPKWRRGGGKILKGLVTRRAIERELFDT